ncbi:T9SS type A sorting domain-containing protein [Niastella caeni]|uniref:T9SS type A sorting domain-containing protein n=1 Tax=Niastella caeni TaxID=2569763 RepID=A0A4V4H1B5_9BACT|nr:T9SS type A sorting domain-containing protein [Niastella caeni]THU39836.1 T9SS type A sorting domain-containing protein [Niastella caeni]
MKKLYSSFIFIFILLFFGVLHCRAQQDTIKAGSFIINMGVIPQTFANGLKPYGLVYDLVKNYKIPVKWVINTSKTKDGIDFTHNGISYRGGTFIIPFEFRTPTINSVISSWEAQGVVGNTSVSSMLLNAYKTFYYAPNWTMDFQNGTLVTNYFANAGIPSSAYGGDSANWKTPAQLGACDDIFVMPHADPTWSTHNNLYYWNKDYKGNIWAACHAVSEMENLTDPSNTIQMNFLSTTGLVNWKDHKKDASPPYQYQDHGHPFMQFMQTMDEATNIGSEKIYIPKSGGGWRSTTTLGVYDASSASVPSLSPGPAAIVAYGRAFGDNNRGWVMYEAGHDHNSSGTEAEKVAAQRAFFNYSFIVAVDRLAEFEPEILGLPDLPLPNQPYDISFNVPHGIDLSNYIIQWTSNCGGTFSSTNAPSVTFTPPAATGNCIVTVTLTDGCGRQAFASEGTLISSVLSASSATLRGSYNATNRTVQLNWTDINPKGTDHYEIQRSENGTAFKTVALFFPDQETKNAGFSYKDKFTVQGTALYRLKINTTGKSVTYSNIIKVMSEDASPQLTVLSNPVKGNIVFEYESPVPGNINAMLIDMNGRVVKNKSVSVQKGATRVQMDSTWPAGMYLLRVVSAGNSIIQKVQLIK